VSHARRIVTTLAIACCLWAGLGTAASAAIAPAPSPSPSPTSSTTSSPSPTVNPCTGAATIIAQAFTPASVSPGGQSTESVTILNCGSAPLTLHLEWTAQWAGAGGSTLPAGCPVYDPLLTAVTIPAAGQTTASLGYSVLAGCTATSLTGSVSSTDVTGVSGSAVLQISGTCPTGAAITAQSFMPPSVSPGGSATENVTVSNCGSAALSTQVEWYAIPTPPSGSTGFPAGCVAYDPILTTISVPVGGAVTLSRQYGVPSACTASALTATVSLPQLPGAPSGTAVLTITAPTPPTCTAALAQRTWPGGFTLTVTVTNQGPALTGWTATYGFGGDQKVTNSWSATVTQTGASVTATNAPWNATLATGASTAFGSNGTWHTSSAPPSVLLLNGHPCTTTVTAT
jgi:Cellulose binding domain